MTNDETRYVLGGGGDGEVWHVWANHDEHMVGVRKEGRGPRLVSPAYARHVADITEARFPDAERAMAFCAELRRLADEVEP